MAAYLHEVRLHGLLTNGTVYFYRCGSDSSGWSEELSFRVARSPDAIPQPSLLVLSHSVRPPRPHCSATSPVPATVELTWPNTAKRTVPRGLAPPAVYVLTLSPRAGTGHVHGARGRERCGDVQG